MLLGNYFPVRVDPEGLRHPGKQTGYHKSCLLLYKWQENVEEFVEKILESFIGSKANISVYSYITSAARKTGEYRFT